MTDMTAVIVPKSDQINADDLIAGDMTITITDVTVSPGQEQPVSMRFQGSNKYFRPCKSMCRVMVSAWGADAKAYIGRSLTLYRDPNVKWGGLAVGGIRIRAMSHIDSEMTLMLSESKANRKPFKVQVLRQPAPQQQAPQQPAAPAMTNEKALELAQAAALKGSAHFREWFNTAEGKECRATGALNESAMAALKTACQQADDPFGLPPINTDAAAETTDAA